MARSHEASRLRMPRVRRARGLLLRLVQRRWLALALGIALAAPGAWLELASGVDSWWVDGLSLILLATGLALAWSGISGRRGDWTQ